MAKQKTKKGLFTGAKVGIGVAIIVVASLLGMYFWRKNKKKKQQYILF